MQSEILASGCSVTATSEQLFLLVLEMGKYVSSIEMSFPMSSMSSTYRTRKATFTPVIEVDAQPSDMCTRREYARWLVSASSALSRNSISKVYPAMYIENNTELAFDDITPNNPDFSSIQGLAEAGLISSKLSQQDMLSSPDTDIGPFYFFPDSPLCRQDLVTWKMALEKRQFSDTNRKMLQQVSGFIDIYRIDPNAWPAVLADISTGEHGIIAHASGQNYGTTFCILVG